MSTGNVIGSAEFHVTADFNEMMTGFKQAEQAARQGSEKIKSSLDDIDKEAARSMKGVAMSMMQVGYIADDLQYGFRSIVNNIQPLGQQIAVAMGAGTAEAMAFGGALGIATVAVNQLVNHWGDLMDALNAAWSGTPIEQLRRIREEAEAAAESWERLAKAPTELQAKSAKGAERAIVEAGPGALQLPLEATFKELPKLFDASMNEVEKAEAERLREILEMQKRNGIDTVETERQVDEQRRAVIRRLLGQAIEPGEAGQSAQERIRAAIEARPGNFPAEARSQLMAMSPEGLRRQREFEQDLKARTEVQRRIIKAEKEHADRLEKDLKKVREGNERIAKAEKEAEKAEEKQRQKVEKQWDAERRVQAEMDAAKRKEFGRLGQVARDKQHADEKAKRDAAHEADDIKRAKHRAAQLRIRVRDIMKGVHPERSTPEFMSHAEFAKFSQRSTFDEANDIRKRQLKALEDIKDLIALNPDKATMINNLVAKAVGPP